MHKKFARRLSIVLVICLIIILLVKVVNIQDFILKKVYKQDYSELVNKYAESYNIDPLWIYAIIKVESNFNPNARSSTGAKGLMQLMDSTAIELSKSLGMDNFNSEMLYDPETNIKLGTKYFDDLLTRYNGNYYLAIAAYNSGIGTVNNWIVKGVLNSDGSNIENIPYKETNIYVRKTVKSYSMYKQLYEQK